MAMPPGSHPTKLFINYRREDTAPYAGRLYDRLVAHFGEDQVFMDIDQIEPGEDFVEVIDRKVGACEIAIISIGPKWLSVTDAAGQRRIDDSEDLVRLEILAALERKIRVIPVLVGGARMPRKQDLPEALAPLSRRNAIELSELRFHADVSRLIEAIEKARVSSEKKPEPLPGPIVSLSEPSPLAKSAPPENLVETSTPHRTAEAPTVTVPLIAEPAPPVKLADSEDMLKWSAFDPPAEQNEPLKALVEKRKGVLVGALAALLVTGVVGGWWFGTQRTRNEAEPQRQVAVQNDKEQRPSAAPSVKEEEMRKKEDSLKAIAAATRARPFENSLGMKFVPVPGTGLLFSVWETRVKDFEAFVKQTRREWPKAGIQQTQEHPAVNVSWDDATAFCEWLTKQERKVGRISPMQSYRLPTDQEWSAGVGLKGESGNTPEERQLKVKNVYPWGTKLPPPAGAGNYAGSEARTGDSWPSDATTIDGYSDGYPETSPVGSFAANGNGIYDLGGNVWEWCEDWYNAEMKVRVLRGGSWDADLPEILLSSFRFSTLKGSDAYGFRCVLVVGTSR